MSHIYTEDQQQIRDEARRYLQESYSGERLKALLTQKGAFDTVLWQACRDMGWTGITIPEAYGGLGLTPLELCIIIEECGRVAAGAPFLASGFALSEALRLWGEDALKEKYLPALATGETIGTFSFAVPLGKAASQPVRFKDGLLFGKEPCVLAGANADLAIILVVDEEQIDALVVVDLRQESVERFLIDTFDNSRGTADLHFNGALAVRLVMPDSKNAVRQLLAGLAVLATFEQVGGADACMETARDYANDRQAFGQRIGKFQSIKHRIAEMYVDNELARGNAVHAALSLSEARDDLTLSAAAARVSATEAYEFAAREAIQVHGAIGVTWEHDLHLHYRRSRSLALELGSAFLWEDVIVDILEKAA